MRILLFYVAVLAAAGPVAGHNDGSARYGPLGSQSGSLVDATPGTRQADQRSVCERMKGKDKQSCLKKKPQQLQSDASQR